MVGPFFLDAIRFVVCRERACERDVVCSGDWSGGDFQASGMSDRSVSGGDRVGPEVWIRSARRWFLAWVVVSMVWAVLHWATWISADARNALAEVIGESAACKIGNVVSVPATPGWLITIRLFGGPNGNLFFVGLVANAIAWGVWFSLLWVAWGVARVFVGAARPALKLPEQHAAAQTDAAVAHEQPDAQPLAMRAFSRRRLLARAALSAGGVATAGAIVKSTLIDPWRLEISRVTVPISDLPASLDGLRLVHISDTHLGPRIPAAWIRHAVQTAIDLQPEVFLLVGDYVHRGTEYITPAAQLFAPLVKTGKPALGVLGNHDWYASGEASRAALRSEGIRMIDNTRVCVARSGIGLAVFSDEPVGTDGALCIAGLGDLQEDSCQPDVALAGLGDSIPRLLLSHNPDAAELRVFRNNGPTRGPRVDLMLSGHTHGGQVRLPLLGTPIVPSSFGAKYAQGLVQGPAFPVLISAGVGMSILPVRWNVPPEIVEVTLKRAQHHPLRMVAAIGPRRAAEPVAEITSSQTTRQTATSWLPRIACPRSRRTSRRGC